MKSFFFRYAPALAWAVLILLVSSIPEPLETTPSEMSSFLLDFEVLGVGGITIVSFVIHFFLYAVLGFLAGRALVGGKRVTPGLFLVGLVLCTAFGVLDELYQQLIPGRGFEWIDITANTIGSAVGIFVFAKKGMADKVMLTGSN
jgi:VanZ family protein